MAKGNAHGRGFDGVVGAAQIDGLFAELFHEFIH